MLDDAEINGFAHIVSWMPDEVAFRVHDKHLFVAGVLSLYFQQTQYKSFQRQLNMWGFERVHGGAYSHEFFVRGQVNLCQKMKRLKIKGKRSASFFPTSQRTVGARSMKQENGSPLRIVTPNTPRCKVSEGLDKNVGVVTPPLPSTRSSDSWRRCNQSYQEDLFDEATLSSVLLLDSTTNTIVTPTGGDVTQQGCGGLGAGCCAPLGLASTQSVCINANESATKMPFVPAEGESDSFEDAREGGQFPSSIHTFSSRMYKSGVGNIQRRANSDSQVVPFSPQVLVPRDYRMQS
eukprot:Nitzschia sp. Nitz4//scaffold156_size52432//12352//13323//NITZ4_006823-RA/size52432-processed-gene-0.50-mRNA-1//-1//CDS//3329537403//8192//frame0